MVMQTALLLADPSPALRRMVLLDLMHRSLQDQEVLELELLQAHESQVVDLCALQQHEGGWGSIRETAVALMRLGFLGYGPDFISIQRGAAYLFDRQQPDGSWPLPGKREMGEDEDDNESRRVGYAMIPLQTAIPLRGLASCGYATDPRCENAYEWLNAQRLPDGAWPTGIAVEGVWGYVAGYRRLAHSRWGCRSNTTGALLCLALHPKRRHSIEAHRALDLLLGRETREEYTLGFEVARLLGAEPMRGFITFYARYDLALLLGLCSKIGAPLSDQRVQDLVDFIRSLQGVSGLWEYKQKPQVSRWITFDLLRSLAGLAELNEHWVTNEPRTPFQPYPKKQKRY